MYRVGREEVDSWIESHEVLERGDVRGSEGWERANRRVGAPTKKSGIQFYFIYII